MYTISTVLGSFVDQLLDGAEVNTNIGDLGQAQQTLGDNNSNPLDRIGAWVTIATTVLDKLGMFSDPQSGPLTR